MEKIASFTINHALLKPGLYISRADGDIVTYDLRFKQPNGGDFLTSAAMHTIEHIVATFVRNSSLGHSVVYFGPMGCRTGFYLIMRGAAYADVVDLIYKALCFCGEYKGEIPGGTAAECGNYLEHDKTKAAAECLVMAGILKNYPKERLNYPV